MTAETTPATDPLEGSKVEQTLKVYLEQDSLGRHWMIDPSTVDGTPLFGLDNDLLPECRPPEVLAEMAAADELPLLNAEQFGAAAVGSIRGGLQDQGRQGRSPRSG